MKVTVNTAHALHRESPLRSPRKSRGLSWHILHGDRDPTEPHRPTQIHGKISLEQWLVWAAWKAQGQISQARRSNVGSVIGALKMTIARDLGARVKRDGYDPYVSVVYEENIQSMHMTIRIKATVPRKTKADYDAVINFEVGP